MANSTLSLEDFLILWAQSVGGNATPKMARRYLEGLHKLLLEELKLNGEMSIYGIGKFFLREVGGYDALMGDPINGGVVRRYINTRVNVEFNQSACLKREVNEGEFEREAPLQNRKRKYKTKAIQREAQNEKRRKPKPTMEQMVLDAINLAEKKKEKSNG